MASALHWPKPVLVTPMRIQVESIVTVPDDDGDLDFISLESSEGRDEEISAASEQTPSDKNLETKHQQVTIVSKEKCPSLASIFCCAKNQTSIVAPNTGESSSTNIFIVSDQEEQGNQEQEYENLEMDTLERESEGEEGIEDTVDKKEDPNYLLRILKTMHTLGLSTYDPEGTHSDESCSKRFLQVLHKLIYWTIAALALLHSLQLTKTNWFSFTYNGGIIYFVDLGFRIVPILTEVFVAHLFAFQHEKLKGMMFWMEELTLSENAGNGDTSRRTCKPKRSNKRKKSWGVVRWLVIVSVLICILQIGAKTNLEKESIEREVLKNSKRISYFIFIWKTDEYFNKSVTAQLKEKYGTHITATTISLGVLRSITEFCNNFKMEMIINLMIIVAWSLKYHIAKHARKVQGIDFSTYTNGNDNDEFMSATGDWAKYQMLKKANNAMNAVFDVLLKFMHIHTMSLVAYFLVHILDNKLNYIQFAVLFYNIMKLTVAYYIAKQSHGYNAVFQKWITDWAIHSKDVQFLLKVPAIVEEMKREPLGLGSGEFIIGETFILKLIGLAGSLFMLQVDKGD